MSILSLIAHIYIVRPDLLLKTFKRKFFKIAEIKLTFKLSGLSVFSENNILLLRDVADFNFIKADSTSQYFHFCQLWDVKNVILSSSGVSMQTILGS